MTDSDDFTQLDDPQFLAERRRVRDVLGSAASPDLTARLEALDEEFLRRARTCWGGEQ
jgi:hypothetical protein